MKTKEFYEKHYKVLILIPLVLLVLALSLIAYQYSKTGDIFKKDVTLKGGISATVYSEKEINADEVKDFLSKKFNNADVVVRRLSEFGTKKQVGINVEISDVEQDKLKAALEEELNIKLVEENYFTEETGSSLGENFYRQVIIALLFAFLLMAIVVFIAFRTLVPSGTVVFVAFSDIAITVAIINLIGVRLSSAGIAALLLLIGYSIDTDILLTTRVVKRREGRIVDRVFSSIKTGLTMSITSIVAVLVAYFVSTSFVIKQISLIIMVGLVVDIIATYCLNAGVLMWYEKRKEGALS